MCALDDGMIAHRVSYDPDKHHRRSIRLRGYDYAQPGAYFVTLCVQQRECLFGEIVADDMAPNEAGHMVGTWWHELARKFPSCDAEAFVVMPNHIHGVIAIRDSAVGADRSLPWSAAKGVRPHDRARRIRDGHVGPPLRLCRESR